MTLRLDFPECCASIVGRWDSRWKLAALGPAAIATALLRTLAPSLAALGGAFLLVALAGLPLRWFAARLAATALVLSLFLVWLPFVHPHGDVLALVLLLKALTIVTLTLVLLASATLQDICKAAHALHVPGVLVQLILLSYRYVFLLADEFGRLRIALRVRGFRNRGTMHSYRVVGQVAGTLLVRGHERAERVGQAMRCRGFCGVFRSLQPFRTTPWDALAWALTIGVAGALLTWDVMAR